MIPNDPKRTPNDPNPPHCPPYGPADRCIQKLCQEFGAGRSQQSVGIMAELLLRAELPLDAVRANLTEFTAGGVDTVRGGGIWGGYGGILGGYGGI